jgi:hydrogenase maturation protease
MNPPPSTSPPLLVIGYGNTLRGDDGVGSKVADAIAALNVPGVEAFSCHQLNPELAEQVSRAGSVVFVDAAMDAPREVRWRPLEAGESSQLMAHAADPRTVLALARDVYGRCPKAWWLTIPIEQTGFSETLSPFAEQGYNQALRMIQDWVQHLR